MEVSLSSPDITSRERERVNQVLNSTTFSMGPMLKEFEQRVAEYIGVKHAIGINSGTSGLHLLIKALGIGEGDEVITTPFSFVASANCILYEKGVPVFVDIDPSTLNLDIGQLEKKITEKTKGILPVDVFGQPMDMEKIRHFANKYGLKVIEDCCEAIGSEYNGRKAGTLCDGGVFAFYPNKQITTAEGGVIVTNDDETARLCKSLRNQGRDSGGWLAHERLGYNYRLSELHSALGVVQMERIEEILGKREKVAAMYTEKLETVEEITLPFIDPGVTRMSWFVYVIQLSDAVDREEVMGYLHRKGIECKAYFPPIHLQPYFRKQFGYQRGDYPITEGISRSTLALPFYSNLEEYKIDYVVDTLKEAIHHNSL